MATETTTPRNFEPQFVWCSYDVFTLFYADDDFDTIFPADPLKLDSHYRLVHAPVCGVKVEDGKTKIQVSGGTWGDQKWPAKIWLQLDDSCWHDLRDASKHMLDRCINDHQSVLGVVYELLSMLDKYNGDFQQPVDGTEHDFADFFMMIQSSMGLRFGYAQQNIMKILQQHRRLSEKEQKS